MKNNSQFSILNFESDESLFEKLSELDRMCIGSEGWSAESFRSEAAKDNGIVLYSEGGGQITALLTGYYAGGEADITSVAVRPEYRRKGLAESLMLGFENHLPEDTEEIFLEVRESNIPAIRLYEKCGFEKLSVRKNFYTNPDENAVVMKKILKGQKK